MQPEDLTAHLATKTLGRRVEHYPVAVTTEAMALGWLRQREGGHGGVVIADREISARGRAVGDWAASDGVAASVILEPELPVDRQDLLWAHALLSARAGYERLGREVSPHWPELLLADAHSVGLVKATSQLGPGGVTSAVLTFRLTGEPEDLPKLLAITLQELERRLDQTPQAVAEEYERIDPLKGNPVVVEMLPRGAIRGRGMGIDNLGAFGVAGTSGHITRVAVDQIRRILRPTNSGRPI